MTLSTRVIVATAAIASCALAPACSDDPSSASTSSAQGGTGGTTTATGGSTTSQGGQGGTMTGAPPTKPTGLVTFLTGNDEDADVTPTGPGLILMGGGTDVDAAFQWWMPYLSGGDIVVLRNTGSDGYNDYLFESFGPVDSVETMLVTNQFGDDPYVAWRIAHAEGIFMAGGDQADYLANWKGTAVEDALHEAWARGAILGGTSAGCAVLGEIAFAATNGTVYSDEALTDPYNQYMQLENDFLALPPMAGVVTDTHFFERDRFGRLVGFIARAVQDGWADPVLGLGVDEQTALVVSPDGTGEVLGTGAVYAIRSNGTPTVCTAGQDLLYENLTYSALTAGDTIALPTGTTTAPSQPVSASGGTLTPADPY